MHALYYVGLLSTVTNLTSSEEDGCGTLHITWTAPYTLLGVSINYYIINITRHSDGAVLRSDTTNATEYLYTVSSLGETLEVLVAAVNDVGTGNSSNLSTQSLLLGDYNNYYINILKQSQNKIIVCREFEYVTNTAK